MDTFRPPNEGSVYSESFSRNIGILTEAEQERLATTTVLIVGTGGIGGNVASILARLGVGGFNLVDPDSFELANINRQFGCGISSIGRPKVEVIAEQIRDINPSARVNLWTEPFRKEIGEVVFDEVDLAIDAIDFYAIPDHLAFHRCAREKRRYVLMGSPVGFSACLQVFDPEGMSLAEYCGINQGMDPVEMQLRYACGIVPRLAHLSYYDVSKKNTNTDFLKGKGPSLAPACTLAAALVASEAATLLLERRKPRAIPHTLQYDPLTFRHEEVYIDGGMTAYDPSDVIDTLEDKSSLVVNIFDHFYRKSRAATLELRDGGALCYRVEGKGQPLVLIPPVGGDTSFWARQGPALAREYKVITLDNRGVGRSSALPHDATVRDMACDVLELLEHLDLQRVVLVGCAMGGLIALEAAQLCPERVAGVSMAAGYAETDDTILETTAGWRRLARTKGMDAVFEASLEWLFAPEYRAEQADEIYKLKTFFRVNCQQVEEFCKQTKVANCCNLAAGSRPLACPIQIVHGGEDRLVVPTHATALHARLAGSQLAVIPGAGHFANWELSGAYNALLLKFIREAVEMSKPCPKN